MQNNSDKVSPHNSIQSRSNNVDGDPSWWNLSASNNLVSLHPTCLFENLEPLGQHANQPKARFGAGIAGQDSSSTQSTEQLRRSVSSERSHKEPHLSSQSGNDNSYEKNVEGQMKSTLSLGATNVVFSPPKLDCNTSVGCLPYTYNNQFYGNFLAAYGPHAVIPQMMGTSPFSRVPLSQQTAEEPIYVNAKQYHAIIRRREQRAKQEAQNKILKTRKPYLHESRHIHAMKRVRGVGGRFVNTKELKKQSQNSAENNDNSNNNKSSSSKASNNSGNGGYNNQENNFGFVESPKNYQCSSGVQHRVLAPR